MALHQPAQPGQLPGPVGVDLLPLLGRSRVEFELVAVGQDTLGGQVGVADDELGQVTTGERDGAVDEIALLGGGAQFHAPVPAPGGEHHLYLCARYPPQTALLCLPSRFQWDDPALTASLAGRPLSGCRSRFMSAFVTRPTFAWCQRIS